jgi:UDP-glucose 4-epimerase
MLVTGASGFIGKNLLLKLPRKWDVVATYYKSKEFLGFLEEKALHNVEPLRVNLESLHETKKKIGGLKFDCVVHLAANTDTLLSVKEPEKDLRLNVLSLLNTVKAVRIKDFIFMSSGAVYDGCSGAVSPATPVAPFLPYAVSKLACERYVAFFKKSGLVNSYVILRFFGAYGPYEPPRKVFTRLVKAFYFEKKQDFMIVGDGNNFIDAMFVDDAVEGLLSVIRSDVRNVTVDFASGKPLRINELVSKVARIFGVENVIVKHSGWPVEYNLFYASNKDMKSLFEFKPKIPLEVGIWKLAKWLQKKCA